MTPNRVGRAATVAAVAGLAWAAGGADAPKKPAAPNDAEMVERVVAARKEYQQALITLYEHYTKVGDKERSKWAEEELKAHHLAWKPSYRLDIMDVPPANLEAKVNIKEANELFRMAMDYKNKGLGTDYILNQKRAEVLFQEILQKYPNCDKIADVAYELGELYEGRAFHQYDRAAAYYERAYQWRKGGRTDALMRAARLYDKPLNERGRAVELYRLVIDTDTDPARIKEAARRRDELTGGRNNP